MKNERDEKQPGTLIASVIICLVCCSLFTTSISSTIVDPLMRDGSLLTGSRYTITRDALQTISNDGAVSVIGTGSSQMFKALDGKCVSEILENDALVYNIAQPSSRAYTDMLHIPRIVNSNPQVVLIEIPPNLLGNTSKSSEEYVELRFKLDTMNQDSTDIGGWVDIIDPSHREWVAMNGYERIKFKQEYVPSAIEERLNRLTSDEKTLGEIRTEAQKYGWIPETNSNLWDDYLQLPIFPPDSRGFDGKTPEEREIYNATDMMKTGNYKPSYRGSQAHAALDYEISTLLEHDIHVIIVSPPHHPAALKFVESGKWDGLNETLEKYEQWPEVTLFDQTWESGWEDEHFYDRNHLDDEGRIEFCNRLAPVIDSILTSQKFEHSTAPKLLTITVDVEAGNGCRELGSNNITHNEIPTCMYGDFGDQRAGIIEMMEIADEVGVKISFFVDVMEYYAYGDQLLQVMQDIDSRGHDVQLHFHLSMINSTNWEIFQNSEEWNESGATKETSMNCWDQNTANFWFSKAMEIFDEANITRPVAYRGGAYRYCDTIIQAMANNNMTQSYNYNMYSENQKYSTGYRHNFMWENGIMEFPISYVEEENGEILKSSRIDESTWDKPIKQTFDAFYEDEPNTRVMTMILHSYSFLDWGDDGQKYLKDYSKLELFRAFMHSIPQDYQVVSTTELQQYINFGIIIAEDIESLESIQNEC